MTSTDAPKPDNSSPGPHSHSMDPYALLANISLLIYAFDDTDITAQMAGTFLRMMEMTGEGLWILDANNRITLVNTHITELLGTSREIMVGREIFDYIATADHHMLQLGARPSQPHALRQVEARLRGKEDSALWVQLMIRPLIDAVGAYCGALVIVRDITQRKLTEEALQKSEGLYRTLIEGVPQLVWIAHSKGRIEYFNQRWYDYTGSAPNQNRDIVWRNALHPQDIREVQRCWIQAMKTGEPYELEYRLRDAQGNYRWFLTRGLPLRDEQGNITRWFGTSTDIENQKRAEQHQRFLAELSQHTRSLVQTEDLLREVASAVGKYLVVSHCSYEEIDTERQVYTIRSAYDRRNDRSLGTFPLTAFGPEVLTVLQRGETFVVDDTSIDPLLTASSSGHCRLAHVRSTVVTPLIRDGRWIANFSVSMHDTPRGWAQDEVFLLEQILEQTWLAVENVQLYQTAQKELLERASAERKALAAHQQMITVLESMTDGFFVLDKDWRYTYVNRSCEQMTELSREEMLGKTLWELYPKTVSSELGQNYRRAMHEQVPIQCELHQTILDRWYGIRIYPWEGGVAVYYQDITERKRTEDYIQWQALHDPLTHLPNRVLFQERFAQAISAASRENHTVSLLFVDLDGFKYVNDSLGHDAGDELLKIVSARFEQCVAPHGMIARMGGDEFTVLLPEQDAHDAIQMALRLLAELQRPMALQGRELFLTASIGISVYPTDGSDSQTLLKHADIAMYRAKDAGRNGCELYTEAMNASALERLVLETSLRKALEREEFVLYYQPQVDMRTGHIIGAEALLRWQHPDFGLLAPDRFIPLAEETGLILPMGEWVLQQACRQAARWQAEGAHLRISVNVSAHQFRNAGLVEAVSRALADARLEARWLDLELTETALVESGQGAVPALATLKSLGISLSVDDFGTGYSSLAYLSRLPLDVLKADRSFVRGIPENQRDTTVIRAMIELAHALGLIVIAEGAETRAQWDCLLKLGCDGLQGFYISPPVPAHEFETLLSPKSGH